MQYLVKIIVTAVLVIAISETARRNQLAGAILASLPTTTILALTWYYYETRNKALTADLAQQVFYLVLPSLAFLAIFPWMMKKDFSFATSMAASSAATCLLYFLFVRFSGLFH